MSDPGQEKLVLALYPKYSKPILIDVQTALIVFCPWMIVKHHF